MKNTKLVSGLMLLGVGTLLAGCSGSPAVPADENYHIAEESYYNQLEDDFSFTYKLTDGRLLSCVYISNRTQYGYANGGPTCDWGNASESSGEGNWEERLSNVFEFSYKVDGGSIPCIYAQENVHYGRASGGPSCDWESSE